MRTLSRLNFYGTHFFSVELIEGKFWILLSLKKSSSCRWIWWWPTRSLPRGRHPQKRSPSHELLGQPWVQNVSRWGAFSEKANFGFFERVRWKGKFWPKFSQNLPLQPKFAFSQNHWNMPKNWNLCPFRHSINFLDESHCKGTEELIQKNNWSHKKFSYYITERVKDSSF